MPIIHLICNEGEKLHRPTLNYQENNIIKIIINKFIEEKNFIINIIASKVGLVYFIEIGFDMFYYVDWSFCM